PGHETTAAPPTPRPYSRPILTRFGDVRDLTMSPSPDTFESGRGTNFRA
ncbi:MAG: lasso RiPP family leader peptide-containing protein, partial [Anaerolineae bacterium]|nr:lasso RiPP family leader peptide-containing protein [Anaerolineae bacterium]